VGRVAHHRVRGVEDVEEAFADGRGEDVALHAEVPRPNPSQRQEHRQRRAHAEEIFDLPHKKNSKLKMREKAEAVDLQLASKC